MKTPSKSKLFTTISSSPFFASIESTEPAEPENQGEKFDWYASGIRVMLIYDLDKRVPYAKSVMGLDIVVWWDKMRLYGKSLMILVHTGYLSEKLRMGNLECKDEVIVDLFTGIRYFTLPFLVRAKGKLVYACEWNPHAIEALRHNLEANARLRSVELLIDFVLVFFQQVRAVRLLLVRALKPKRNKFILVNGIPMLVEALET
ncbi:unnamed protein product [Dovyalis caffra]|uniref:TRM5/TYW2-like methyltransferase domain-containing protein n=1 Tax=Dovyalis caffra TaxID=77055 RepID=A0AAV1S1Y7_9ROSI|nr:unnamed protein product [Dovyalis caffra]